MTLAGTNTWIIGPAGGPCLVVDPGPLDEPHLAQVADVAGAVAVSILTHRHLDHSSGAARFAELTGAGVRAVDPAYATALGDCDGRLVDGQQLRIDPYLVEVIATPGHTADSVSLLVVTSQATAESGAWLLTGDTVLGIGPTVIAQPDGDLGAYLQSLDRLQALVESARVSAILPGHGPVVTAPSAKLSEDRDHRQLRLDQVRQALKQGATDVADVLAVVYPGLDPRLQAAAKQSIQAQLAYLRKRPGGRYR